MEATCASSSLNPHSFNRLVVGSIGKFQTNSCTKQTFHTSVILHFTHTLTYPASMHCKGLTELNNYSSHSSQCSTNALNI
jgi:hypothetical protein